MSKVAVVIPVRNESESIGQVISSLRATAAYSVIVVDDASTDDSRERITSAGATLVPLAINLGAWGAMQTGMRFALKQGFDYVITMDGDGQHHCDEIPRLMSALNDNRDVDVVIGACVERGSKLRRFAWRFFRRLTGVGIEDITSGFRVYNRKALQVLVKRSATLLDYQDIGVLLLLQKWGIRVGEVNVSMSPRTAGKSHIYYSWFAVIYYMLLTTILSLSKGAQFGVKSLKVNR